MPYFSHKIAVILQAYMRGKVNLQIINSLFMIAYNGFKQDRMYYVF